MILTKFNENLNKNQVKKIVRRNLKNIKYIKRNQKLERRFQF